MIAYGGQGPRYAGQLWTLCANDLLFWLNTFGWIYEPRIIDGKTEPQNLPFITYDFQDMTLRTLEQCYGRRDVHMEKSRTMGATWMVLALFLHRWQFRPNHSLMCVSRNESMVDSKDNSDSLFEKLRHLLRWQPSWLKPIIVPGADDKQMLLRNPENGSIIKGTATTSSAGVGGRSTAVLMDEFAKVQPVSDQFKMSAVTREHSPCRIFVSTPESEQDAFAAEKKKPAIEKLSLHWSLHPQHRRGLYKVVNGQVQVLDPDYYKTRRDYVFVKSGSYFWNGKLRSPWYDGECDRATHPMDIRTQLDIDYAGSSYPAFDGALLGDVEIKYCRPAYHQGDFVWNDDKTAVTFVPGETGKALLWLHLDAQNKPPKGDEYVIGADTSQGTGASNSCLNGRNEKTKEQVLEWVDPFIDPKDFGKLAVAICKWFGGANGGADLIWEANGPGRSFGNAVLETGYSRIWWRRQEDKASQDVTNVPGWWSAPGTKDVLLNDYKYALKTGGVTERSKSLVAECRQYSYVQGKGQVHNAVKDSQDLSGAGDNHGDRVIAAALTYKLARLSYTTGGGVALSNTTDGYPPDSFGAHWQRLERERNDKEQHWF